MNEQVVYVYSEPNGQFTTGPQNLRTGWYVQTEEGFQGPYQYQDQAVDALLTHKHFRRVSSGSRSQKI